MAEFIIVSVKDTVTGEFLSPQYVHNHEEAKRLFRYQLANTPTWLENSEQFEMYDLGMLDTTTGNIFGNDEPGTMNDIPVIHPELICKGNDILAPRKE